MYKIPNKKRKYSENNFNKSPSIQFESTRNRLTIPFEKLRRVENCAVSNSRKIGDEKKTERIKNDTGNRQVRHNYDEKVNNKIDNLNVQTVKIATDTSFDQKLKTDARNRTSTNNSHSKSVFQEINQRFSQYQSEGNIFRSSQGFSDNFQNILENNSVIHSFTQEVSKIMPEEKVMEEFMSNRSKIKKRVNNMKQQVISDNPNDIRESSRKISQSHSNYVVKPSKYNKTDLEAMKNFQYFRPSEWVFRTPPRRRIPATRVPESRIKPALMYGSESGTIKLQEMSHPHSITTHEIKESDYRFVDDDVDFLEIQNSETFNFCNNFQLDLGMRSNENLFKF